MFNKKKKEMEAEILMLRLHVAAKTNSIRRLSDDLEKEHEIRKEYQDEAKFWKEKFNSTTASLVLANRTNAELEAKCSRLTFDNKVLLDGLIFNERNQKSYCSDCKKYQDKIDYQTRYIKLLENEVKELRDKLERIDCILTED